MTDAATGEGESSNPALQPRRSRQRWVLLGYALATLLAFPHELPGGGVLDLGLVASWAVVFFLVLGLEGRTPRQAARAAFAASMLGHGLLFHWFFVVTVVYGGMPAALGAASPILPALYVSIFTAAFGAAWAWLGQRGRSGIVLGAALWVSLDLIRADFLGGFPWATLGYGLHLDAPLLGLTRWTGVYGLSFAAAALGIAAARWRIAPSGPARREFVWTIAATALAHGIGAALLALGAPEPEDATRLRIAAIQGNVDQGQKWDAARREQHPGQVSLLEPRCGPGRSGLDCLA